MGFFDSFKSKNLNAQAIDIEIIDETISSEIRELITRLNFNFPKDIITLDFHKNASVAVYQRFLMENLRYSLKLIADKPENNEIEALQGMKFPFKDSEISFSIEIHNKNFEGRYTTWCPEIRGCITEGNSKMEAFENLTWALAEALFVNHDYLNINPLAYPLTPLPQYTEVHFPETGGMDILRFARNQLGDRGNSKFHIYLGNRHLVLKKFDPEAYTITLPLSGFNDFTLHCYKSLSDLINSDLDFKRKHFS